LTVPLLGLDDPADIDISAIGNEITIRVDTAPDSKIPPHVYLLRERRFGRFERKINLPAAIRPEGITAELLRNHVLRIRVPRR
jgi:HSP20 family molecular chaperone IbpA